MSDSSTSVIQVGMACRSMNPPLGTVIVGFPGVRPNTGIDLDLCARAAVFAEPGADRPSAAMVVLDNIGVSAGVVASIRAAAAEAVPGLEADSIMVGATHTHSAPALSRFGRSKPVDPTYVQLAITTAAAAIADAWGARGDVRMRVGCGGAAELHHNRRVVDADGKATNVWLDLEGEHTGYTNPDVPFVVFEDAKTGAVSGMLVSYGCHPVAMGPGSLTAGPDYPGYFVRKLEAATGAATVIHVTGGGGDINPRDCLGDTSAQARQMGETLADVVSGAMAGAAACDAAPIRTASVPLPLTLGPNAQENYSNRADDAGEDSILTTEVQAIRLGDWIIVSAPGELFSQIAKAMEEAAPVANAMVAGYTNDLLGYLFTDAALIEGGYEPRNGISENIEKPLIAAARDAMAATCT